MKKAAASLWVVFALGYGASAYADVDVIATRQAMMDLHLSTMTAVDAAVKANVDVKKLSSAGSALVASAQQLPALFPPGSDKGRKNRALPEIWSDRSGFEKAASDLEKSAERLAELGKAGNTSEFVSQVAVVGGTCNACHKSYRAR